jgi:hypothetical protein
VVVDLWVWYVGSTWRWAIGFLFGDWGIRGTELDWIELQCWELAWGSLGIHVGFGVCVGSVGVRSCVQLGIAGIVFADLLAGSWLGCFVLVFPHTAIRHAIKATICGSYAI